jgi:hypothetical protein
VASEEEPIELDEELEGLEDEEADPTVAAKLPQFYEFFRPLLEVLADGQHWKVAGAVSAVADLLGLDEEARALTLASGRLVLENRVRWAFTSLSKAALVEIVGPSTFRITVDGVEVLGVAEAIDRDFLIRTRPTYAAWHVDMGIEQPAPTSADAGPAVWMIRAGRGGAYAPDFIKQAAAIVGWGQTGGLYGLEQEAIAERVSSAFASESARQRSQATNTLFHVVHGMQVGDLVVTPEPETRTLLLGRVSGPYRFLDDPIADGYGHAREVHWFSRVSRDELSYGARNSLGAMMTLSRPGHGTELLQLADAHAQDTAPEPLAQTPAGSVDSQQVWAPVAVPASVSVPRGAALAEFPTFSKQLMQMLDQLHTGELALPDFQRSFVWAPDATRELIVSIIRGFPAGNLLFFRGGSTKFKARTTEGAPDSDRQPFYLILDGQQRLTSLYQALLGVGESRFFIDVGGLLKGAVVDECVQVFPTERIGALAELETQANALMMPLSRVRNGESIRWIDAVVKARDDEDPDHVRSVLYDVQQAFVEPLVRYAFPVTELPATTELEAVCTIFETLNRTGKPLTTFELISARAFAGGLSLNDYWASAKHDHTIIEDFDIDPVYLLQVIALRVGPSAKRGVVLRLPAEVIEREWQAAVESMAAALSMLRTECGVLTGKWLPYRPMLIPLAVAWREITNATGPAQGAMRAKLIRWFWCACFTGEYESSSASLAERDSPLLTSWLAGGDSPPVVSDFGWDPERWRSVTTRQQGLYKATIALMLSQAPRDFHTAAPLTPALIDEAKIDDHHIFPRAYLRDVGLGAEADTVLNHALIDRATNVRIGKHEPSSYLTEIRSALGKDLDAVLTSHHLPAETDSPLTKNDYYAFLTWRLGHLADLLADKTGANGAPTPVIAPHLHNLDNRIAEIELALRELINDKLDGDPALLPTHVLQSVTERQASEARKQPGGAPAASQSLEVQLYHFDLRELQDTITNKSLWPRFTGHFVTKELLAMRFGQLAELRNAIRHSRPVTDIVRNDGEAAIAWFRTALADRAQPAD